MMKKSHNPYMAPWYRFLQLIRSRPGRTFAAVVLVFALIPLAGPYIENHFLAGHIANIEAKDWLAAWVLWWTILSVALYSYTTYSQRNIAREDLDTTRRLLNISSMQYSLATSPYLELQSTGDYLHPDMPITCVFRLRNIGAGLARTVKFAPVEIDGQEVRINTISVVPGQSDWIEITGSDLSGLTSAEGGALYTTEWAATMWNFLTIKEPVLVADFFGADDTHTYHAEFKFSRGVKGYFKILQQYENDLDWY